MFVFALLLSLAIFAPSEQYKLGNNRKIIRSNLPDFKGIPKFEILENDEKREFYYYEQTILVKDSGNDDKLHRCEVMEVYDESLAKEILRLLQILLNLEPQKVNMKMILSFMGECDKLDDGIPIVQNEFKPNDDFPFSMDSDLISEPPGPNPLFHGIFPGTNWCGLGDIAENYHDLNAIRNVDKCCRAHDLCPIKIRKHDKRYSLENTARYTTSHCTCDEYFHNCLKQDKGWSAKIIGYLYFYVGKPQCIQGHPEETKETMQIVKAIKKW